MAVKYTATERKHAILAMLPGAIRVGNGQRWVIQLSDGKRAMLKTSLNDNIMVKTDVPTPETAKISGFAEDVDYVLAVTGDIGNLSAYLVPLRTVEAEFRTGQRKWMDEDPENRSNTTWSLSGLGELFEAFRYDIGLPAIKPAEARGHLAAQFAKTFDLKKALGLPDIIHSIAKRDDVLNRFGPLFRRPSRLTAQDYHDFLSLKHNHHWSGLERLGRPAAKDMDNLRTAISILVDEAEPLSERFDRALSMIPGVGVATLSPMLLLAYPDRYGVWNGTSEPEMRDRGIWPSFPHGSSSGKKYQIINSVLIDLAEQLGIDLWTLDALWWVSKLEQQNNGEIKDARFTAVWSMANQAEQTARQSYGQTVERTVKNKDLRLSKEELIMHLNELLDEAGNRCAITSLALQFEGTDDQLRPSLDRIDSNGHYEVGNLQVVARFINFWKRDTEDTEFRRLIAVVRGE